MRGYSQEKLCHLLNYQFSRPTISQIENGDREIKFSEAELICKALEFPITALSNPLSAFNNLLNTADMQSYTIQVPSKIKTINLRIERV